jgi:energy-coupling factor transporter ATP-binding protein EcfA2
MNELIDYDNSFDIGTSISLRGNSASLNGMYEFVKAFKRAPSHHINLRLSKTRPNDAQAEFMTRLGEFLGDTSLCMERLSSYDIGLHQENIDIEHYKTKAELLLVRDLDTLFYVYNAFGSHITISLYTNDITTRDWFTGVVDQMAIDFHPQENLPAGSFNMVTQCGPDLELVSYKIDKKKFSDFDINRQYNDDFAEVAAHIESSLEASTTGIVLLHGIPGSGKTTYLRHLISILKKRVIYMPPDMTNALGSPAFFSFIRQYPDSVLVVEDAEDILRKRMEGSGAAPAISNILNLSDGILGDALNIQVVCTFNADIGDIDDALLRPGRLIANHFFGKLSEEKTLGLVKHVHGEDAEPESPSMTVAEVYKMAEEAYNSAPPAKKQRMGFV